MIIDLALRKVKESDTSFLKHEIMQLMNHYWYCIWTTWTKRHIWASYQSSVRIIHYCQASYHLLFLPVFHLLIRFYIFHFCSFHFFLFNRFGYLAGCIFLSIFSVLSISLFFVLPLICVFFTHAGCICFCSV